MKGKLLSHVRLLATPWTTAYQAPPSMDFPGKSTGVGCHCLLQCKCVGQNKKERDSGWDLCPLEGTVRTERFLSLWESPLHHWWGASEDGIAASLQSGQPGILHGWSMPAPCVPQTETCVYLVLKLRLQTSGPGKGLGLAAQRQLEGAGVWCRCH